jgi:hypothetical protein
MKKFFLILFAIAVSGIMQSRSPFPPDVCTVSGTVKDTSGSPIPGAYVVAVRYSPPHSVVAQATTDLEGKYSMAVPYGTCVKYQVSAIGYIQLCTAIGEIYYYPTVTNNYTLQEAP